jgi:hypothetical protein
VHQRRVREPTLFRRNLKPLCRQRHVQCPECVETEMRFLSSAIASLAIALLLTAFFPSTAEANITLSQRGCQSYASWSGNIVWARKLGADKEKARTELIELDEKTPSSIFALMLRNFESLWTTQASWELVTRAVLEDCINRRGIYEAAT